jgi:hypothetical protein
MSRRALAATALALLLAGCAVGPDFKPPAAPAVTGFTPEPLAPDTATAGDVTGGAVQHFAVGQDIPGEWWTLFQSEPLNTLVAEALKSNPDLAAAQAALRQARELAKAQTGVFLPQVDASFQHEREKANGLAFGLPNDQGIFSVNTAQLNVAYTVDVFGGERRQLESAGAGGVSALPARGDLSHADLQRRRRGGHRGFLRGADRRHARTSSAETDQLDVVHQQFTLGGVAKSDVLTQQSERWRSRRPRCRRCKSSWRRRSDHRICRR